MDQSAQNPQNLPAQTPQSSVPAQPAGEATQPAPTPTPPPAAPVQPPAPVPAEPTQNPTSPVSSVPAQPAVSTPPVPPAPAQAQASSGNKNSGNGMRKIFLILLILFILFAIGAGGYYWWSMKNTPQPETVMHVKKPQVVTPTLSAPSATSDASFAPKNTAGWKTYADSSYSFLYPPTWTVKVSSTSALGKEQVQVTVPSHTDIQAHLGPNPHGNPGGGGGPASFTVITNPIQFTFHNQKQNLSEYVTLMGAQKTFSKVIFDQIMLDSTKDLDASIISYQPSMTLGEYYDIRNTFLTLLQTLIIK